MRQPIVGILLLGTILLSGCKTVRGAATAGYSGTGANASVRTAYIPVGRVIERRSRFAAAGGGYAIVLLRRANAGRNHRACVVMRQAMQMRVGPADGRPITMDGTIVEERPVYWPVKTSARLNCQAMLAGYDFDRAFVTLQATPNFARLGQGPFVVVRMKSGSQAGFFDFSNVAVEDFNEQFAAVVNYVSQRTDVWSPDFYSKASLRQVLRYYVLDRSGGGPLVLAGLFSFKGR